MLTRSLLEDFVNTLANLCGPVPYGRGSDRDLKQSRDRQGGVAFARCRTPNGKWLLPFALAAVCASAQTFQGGVRGQVKDQGGAMVPDVKITLINEATGEQRATLSNESGEYTFTAVNPAAY